MLKAILSLFALACAAVVIIGSASAATVTVRNPSALAQDACRASPSWCYEGLMPPGEGPRRQYRGGPRQGSYPYMGGGYRTTRWHTYQYYGQRRGQPSCNPRDPQWQPGDYVGSDGMCHHRSESRGGRRGQPFCSPNNPDWRPGDYVGADGKCHHRDEGGPRGRAPVAGPGSRFDEPEYDEGPSGPPAHLRSNSLRMDAEFSSACEGIGMVPSREGDAIVCVPADE